MSKSEQTEYLMRFKIQNNSYTHNVILKRIKH